VNANENEWAFGQILPVCLLFGSVLFLLTSIWPTDVPTPKPCLPNVDTETMSLELRATDLELNDSNQDRLSVDDEPHRLTPGPSNQPAAQDTSALLPSASLFPAQNLLHFGTDMGEPNDLRMQLDNYYRQQRWITLPISFVQSWIILSGIHFLTQRSMGAFRPIEAFVVISVQVFVLLPLDSLYLVYINFCLCPGHVLWRKSHWCAYGSLGGHLLVWTLESVSELSVALQAGGYLFNLWVFHLLLSFAVMAWRFTHTWATPPYN
jgi:hypothetical protein